jgi:hypothetical protein
MKPWEQRLTGWGSLATVVVSLLVLLHLERDRLQNPLAAPVGVSWEKAKVRGGADTIPVQYTDAVILSNSTDQDFENVEIVVTNWSKATEIKTVVDNVPTKHKRRIELIDRLDFPRHPYEIDPRDVLIIRCRGYADKRIPVKELGKDKLLRDTEKQEDKDHNADPQFWSKFWKWLDDLRKQGIEPTEDLYQQWLKDKERARKDHPPFMPS